MAVTQKTAENFGLDQGATFSKNFTITTDGSTAYDISGKNQANNISLDKAILLNLKIISKNG